MIENFFTLSETHLRGLFLARTTPTLLPLLSLAFFAQPRLMRRNRVRMNFLFPKTHFDYKKIVLDIILCHSFAYYFTHVDPFLCLAIWTIFKKGYQKSGQKMVTWWVFVKFCMWSLILLKIWHPLATCQNSMSWFTMTCSAIQASIHFNQD